MKKLVLLLRKHSNYLYFLDYLTFFIIYLMMVGIDTHACAHIHMPVHTCHYINTLDSDARRGRMQYLH